MLRKIVIRIFLCGKLLLRFPYGFLFLFQFCLPLTLEKSPLELIGLLRNPTSLPSTTTTSSDPSPSSSDVIKSQLTTSLTAYNSASANDLVKITLTEYNAITSTISNTTVGYNLAIDNSLWATSVGVNQTYSYISSFSHPNTLTTIPNSHFVVLFTFVPPLNPQNSFSCQLKYNNGGTLTNLSNLYSGATTAVQDRHYFVIKTPTNSVSSTGSNFLAIYSSAGIGTTTITSSSHNYNVVAGNVVGFQSFSSGTAADTQYPTMQARSTSTKQW